MPTRFRFRLDKVIEVRQQREDEARLALTHIQLRYQEKSAHLDRLRIDLAECDKRAGCQDGSTGPELWLWHNYRRSLEEDIRTNEREVQALARELNSAREEVVQRSKERQVLEMLKERQARAYAEAERRKEQKELDDIATLRYQRKDS